MSKRITVRIVSYALAVIFALSGFLFCEHKKLEKNELELNNGYIKNLNALETSMNNITDTLDKASCLKSGTDLLNLSTTLFCEGETAKNALAALPNGTSKSGTLYKFLSQVGNYAVSISKSAINGEISDEDNAGIANLYKTSKTISKIISRVNENYDNIDDFAKIINENVNKEVDVKTLASTLDGLEKELNDYPTLIYDGPFSDHLLNKQPLMTSNGKVYSKEYCRQVAQKFFGIKSDLNYSGSQDGKIKSYIFEKENFYCCVTKNGGYVSFMRNGRDVKKAELSADEAVKKAENFLEKNGLINMKSTYYYTVDGECTVNFAYMSDDTLCYTDLIKVGVALDTGEIVFYEATGYLTNHTSRPFEKPPHSEQEARQKVNKRLMVKSSKLCLIPTDSGGEIRCYEFLCETPEKSNVFVYVSVKNLSTVKILLVDKSASGVLVK